MGGTVTRPALRRHLLDLIAEAPGPAPDLSPTDWDALDALAAEHRLQPLLHSHRRADPAVPERLRAVWKAAHREAGLIAMTQRADLLDTVALLRAEGIEPVAMKGAWLAWHAYPQPTLRPMRDLDLLVPS